MHARVRVLAAGLVLAAIPWTAGAAGEVTPGEALESETSFPANAVELADVDADGVLDAVVVGSSPTARFACYTGSGDGTFGAELTSGYLYLQPTDLVTGDFNGDGILDIAGINNACSG